MEKTNFVHLHIYRLSEKLADEIWKIVSHWHFFARNTVGIQIVKAADSIGANIAEGSGRGADPELRRFLRVSRGFTIRNAALVATSVQARAFIREADQQAGTVSQ